MTDFPSDWRIGDPEWVIYSPSTTQQRSVLVYIPYFPTEDPSTRAAELIRRLNSWPALLEACEELVRLMESRIRPDELYDDERAAIQRARDAIAKARGETKP